MKRFLLPLCFLLVFSGFSCTDLRKLVGQPPEPEYCNIFNTQKGDDWYLECERPNGEYYQVDSIEGQMYLAAHINQLIEQITWIRQVEVLLEEAQAFDGQGFQGQALEVVRKYRESLEGEFKKWRLRYYANRKKRS